MQIGPQMLRHETCKKKKKKKFRRIRRRFQGAVRFRRLIRRLNRRIYSFGPRCRFLPFTNKSEGEPAACFSLRISSDSASEGCASAAQSCTHFPEKKIHQLLAIFSNKWRAEIPSHRWRCLSSAKFQQSCQRLRWPLVTSAMAGLRPPKKLGRRHKFEEAPIFYSTDRGLCQTSF